MVNRRGESAALEFPVPCSRDPGAVLTLREHVFGSEATGMLTRREHGTPRRMARRGAWHPRREPRERGARAELRPGRRVEESISVA
jgi:hypothetical protein